MRFHIEAHGLTDLELEAWSCTGAFMVKEMPNQMMGELNPGFGLQDCSLVSWVD